MILALWLACAGEADTAVPVNHSPDFEILGLDDAFQDAAVSSVRMSEPWRGLEGSLGLADPGCPTLYAGPPDGAEGLEGGASWADDCVTSGGWSFDGWAWWDVDLQVEAGEEPGDTQTVDARRRMAGDGVVLHDGLVWGFVGEAEDAFTTGEEDGATTMSYESQLDYMYQGAGYAAAYRVQMYSAVLRTDVETYTFRGELTTPGALIEERFDTVRLDTTWEDADGVNCAREPRGYIGLRDLDGVWFELVFSPTDDGEWAEVEDTDCDACGTLYVGGVAWDRLCPGISRDTVEEWIETPSTEEYVFSLHGLEAGRP